ncbi:MAG: cytochrome c family protein [Pirellulales bacterium]|nr:cytochrome c family protein [Pirellulales bacterium]
MKNLPRFTLTSFAVLLLSLTVMAYVHAEAKPQSQHAKKVDQEKVDEMMHALCPAASVAFADMLAENTAETLAENTLEALAVNTVEEIPADTTGREMTDAEQYAIDQAHAACFADDPFPSAKKCQQCHPEHYREWSVSPHAYAQLSPVFNAMSNRLRKLTNGTLGDFCIRCHTPVGMALEEPINMSNLDRHPAAREGVTCVTCHRINQAWGKGAGRQALVAGGLTAPIYGPLGHEVLSEVLADPEKYGVVTTDPQSDERARPIHRESIPFFQLTTSGFCGACHDVFAPNGFRLEDAFSEYKTSPAAREKGQSCQDCHMGIEPGVAAGYECAPAAKVGNVFTRPRKRTNHMMIGPDYSVVHPGLFPHNPKAIREEHPAGRDDLDQGLATMKEWLMFDHEAGWGTSEFEHQLSKDSQDVFPEPWRDQARRFRAREILNEQFALLKEADVARHQILSTAYQLGDVKLDGVNRRGLHFRVKVSNGTDGHGVPTGFDAERLVFLRVTVLDSCGKVVFISGDLDPNGDVRDSHSFYVHNGLLPLDRQLFSLQSRFITRNIRGGEREQILNVPYSLDPLPYIRPATRPFTVLGRPLGARKHKQNIEVNGHRWAKYSIKPELLTGHGPYYCQVQLVAGMVPINLVHEISSVGFDYHLSAKEVAERVVDGHLVLHNRSAVFHVDK